jgi:hypothetical protein
LSAIGYLKLLRYDLSCMTLVLNAPNAAMGRPFNQSSKKLDEIQTKLKFPDAHWAEGKAWANQKKRASKNPIVVRVERAAGKVEIATAAPKRGIGN